MFSKDLKFSTINLESKLDPSSTMTISKVFGESSTQKLSSNSLISSGLLYTGIINEKSLAIIQTNLKNEFEIL